MKEADPNTIGGRIRIMRRQRKMTQHQLADRVGVSRPSIALYETQSEPSRVIVGRIAAALGVPRLYLEHGEGECDPGPIISNFDNAVALIRGRQWKPAEATALKALIDVGTRNQ